MTATDAVRKEIRSRLTDVALPDSRYHLDFAEFIPDFIGSDRALARVRELPCYRTGRYAFVTPDNCLTELRARMLRDGKSMVVSTYGIYRGFVLLEPGMVPEGQETFAAWLDGLEHFGRAVTLAEIAARGAFDFMVTGASAVSLNGVALRQGPWLLRPGMGNVHRSRRRRRADTGRCRGARPAGRRGRALAQPDRYHRRLDRNAGPPARAHARGPAPAWREVGAAHGADHQGNATTQGAAGPSRGACVLTNHEPRTTNHEPGDKENLP